MKKISRRLSLLFFISTTSISTSYAGLVEQFFQFHQMNQEIPLTSLNFDSTIEQHWFKQIVNHEAPSHDDFFQQRYYVDESFSQSHFDPVFLYICGESSCEKNVLNSAIRYYAKQFNAKLIALEHRYYGMSQPRENLSVEHLKFLSTQAALDDLAYFQKTITMEKNWLGPWVAFGGSYPGSLAAFYRLKYPELAVGALASSAPVQAKEDFFEYDKHMTEVLGEPCAQRVRTVVAEIETVFQNDNEEAINNIKSLFDAQDVKNNTDFLYLIADIAAGAVQYGMHHSFCSALDNQEGPLAGYAQFSQQLFKQWGINAIELTPDAAREMTIDKYQTGVGSRQWLYQSCKEYGYWQNANLNRMLSTRSSSINNDYHREVCKRLFGIQDPVQTERTNRLYYYPLLHNSIMNILFTNGSNDPWSVLSLNQNNGNPSLDYYTVHNAAHCEDLKYPAAYDSNSLQQARDKTQALLQKWLGKEQIQYIL